MDCFCLTIIFWVGKMFKKKFRNVTFGTVEFKFWELVSVSALIGIICGLIMPGHASMFGFLAWFMIAPLLVVMKKTNSIFQSAILALVFGACFNAITILWIMSIWSFDWAGVDDVLTTFMSIGVWIVISLWCGLFFALWGGITKVILNSSGARIIKNLLIAFFWVVCISKLMSVGELAFPWGQIEYTQYQYLNLIQAISIIKGSGLAFLIIFVNAHIAFCIFAHRKVDNVVTIFPRQIILPVIIFIVLFVFGTESLDENFVPMNKNITVSQLAVDSDVNNDVFLRLYEKNIQRAPAGLIVFPEVGRSTMLRNTNPELTWFLRKSSNEEKTIVTGLWGRGFDSGYNNYLSSNDAVVFSKNSEQAYTKKFLVPFGEFIPKYVIPKILEEEFFDKFLPYPLIRGDKSVVWDTEFGKIAPSICYEIMFPALFREQAKMGTDIYVNISNLQWFSSEILQSQFLSAAIFRAVENRRFVISAIKGGRSFVISPKGNTVLRADKVGEQMLTKKI